ncbi:MAG TPA: MarR family transcriptional regulator [Ktedonobacteraceae bacterium]
MKDGASETSNPNDTQDQQFNEEETQDLQWFTNLERAFPKIYQRIRDLIRENAHEIHPDLDGAGYVLLVQIRHRAPIRATELVEYINIDKSAISRQVRLLFDLKLVDRVDDPNDSRAYLLVPTPEGVRLIDQLQIARMRRLQAAFPHITAVFELLFTPHDTEDDENSKAR